MNQHLIRSICAIRAQGGVALANGDKAMPDPILIGRNAEKIEALARAHGIARWGTDLDAALANKEDTVFFDAATTQMRPALLRQAIEAGKHVYCEKPLAHSVWECRAMAEAAKKHRRVTQMGTQIHAGGNYRRVVELVRAGAIGPVRAAVLSGAAVVCMGGVNAVEVIGSLPMPLLIAPGRPATRSLRTVPF